MVHKIFNRPGLVIVTVVIMIVVIVTVVMVTVVTVVIVRVLTVAKGTVKILTTFRKNNLTPRQLMRCSQGSVLKFLQCLILI